MTGPWSSWLPGPDLCGADGYWLVGGGGPEALAEEPQEAPGPVLTHWWVETGSEVSGCGAVLVLACWWLGSFPEMTGCIFWGVLKRVLAYR